MARSPWTSGNSGRASASAPVTETSARSSPSVYARWLAHMATSASVGSEATSCTKPASAAPRRPRHQSCNTAAKARSRAVPAFAADLACSTCRRASRTLDADSRASNEAAASASARNSSRNGPAGIGVEDLALFMGFPCSSSLCSFEHAQRFRVPGPPSKHFAPVQRTGHARGTPDVLYPAQSRD